MPEPGPLSQDAVPHGGDRGAAEFTRLSILIRIGQALAVNLELGPLLETVYEEVSRLFDTTNFFIVLRRQQEFEFTLAYEHGQRQPVVRHSLGEGMTGYILRTGETLFFPTVAGKQAFQAEHGITAQGEPAKSWIGVPLIVGEQVVGAMVIQNYDAEGIYSAEDLELFSAIASQLAVAIRNAQLYEDVQRRVREMEALADIGRDLTSTLDLEGVLGRIAMSIRTMLTHDSVGIFFNGSGGDEFPAIAASGLIEDPLSSLTVRRGKGILGSVIETGRAEIVADGAADPRAIHIAGTPPTEAGEKVMAAPLFSQDRVIGVIGVWRLANEAPFEHSDLFFLESFSRQASLAIRNAQLFAQAKAALAEAEGANHAKSSFLANMSHELRTPLNAILLYSELLADEVKERGAPALGADLERIQGAGRHLLVLIDDILDLSKIEAGRMTVCLEDCDVPAILREITATIAPLVAKNRNRLVLETDPSIHMIHSDQKKMRQILYNLLSNASKFTKDGIITLGIRRDDLSGRVRFTVTDTGIGISGEQLERIFQEFGQAEDSTAKYYGGTGLGLTLCRKFVTLLGGEIQVTSEAGSGSTFIVRLPGLLPDHVATEAPSVSARGRILVVDDDGFVCDVVARMLKREGFHVLAARSGAEGLALARSWSPHTIILDIAMPGLDGWQVLMSLKADQALKYIPVVILTMLDDRAKGLALEAADYLQKPVTKEQLLHVIERLVPAPRDSSILVVEDEDAVREGLCRILERAGLCARSAADGGEAIRSVERNPPELVLLDLMMSGTDGFQVLEAFRANEEWSRIPVVILTAKELTSSDRERLAHPQVREVIRKGAQSREDLVIAIRNCLASLPVSPASKDDHG